MPTPPAPSTSALLVFSPHEAASTAAHPFSPQEASGAMREAVLSPKLCPRAQAAQRAAALPRPRVFTNGVFDLLHRGHVECLQQARALGGSLIVGLNSDASVRQLHKGPERPLNPQADRAVVLAALQSVDLVVVFDEPTPLALLEALQPEIYVKGGDYDVAQLPEAALMARWGGQALALPYLAGRSTTGLVQRLRITP